MPKPSSLLKGFEKAVAIAGPSAKRQVIFDGATTGLALIVSPKGKKTFSIVARTPAGKQVWKRIGEPGLMTVAQARDEAVRAVERVKAGEAPLLPAQRSSGPETFEDVARDFLKRHVHKQGLRSAGEIERQFNRYVFPAWGAEPFVSIRRGKVVELLDSIEDNSGPVMADRVLATLRKLFNWREVRDEDYTSPVVRGMRASSAKERARKRILSDHEIRALWADWSIAGTFGAFLQTCLLTAQRRGKVLSMKRADVNDGVWSIPAEPREKVNAGNLELPDLALQIIAARPEFSGNPYVFAGRGTAPIGNIGHDKAAMDKRVPTAEPWTIHDLRRTAKSLMARAGVRPDISERTLGHVIPGVEGVYDQHSYAEEKAEALAALARLVERILQGDQDNIVPLRKVR